MNSLKTLIGKFSADQGGVSTVWSIFWTIIFLITAGIAIDTSNAYRFRSALQATADSASLSAAMAYRDRPYYQAYTGKYDAGSPEDRGREVGKQIALTIMGTKMNGTVVSDSEVEFGEWTSGYVDGGGAWVPGMFDTTSAKTNSVKVVAKRTRATDNQLETIFLGLFGGLQSFDVGAVSITEFYKPECASREGVMAGNTLNIASNNTFRGDLCLYGKDYVDMNNNIFFYDDSLVEYSLDGQICMGFSVCGEDVLISANPTIDGRMNQTATGMPNIPDMYDNYQQALADPAAALNDLTLKQYIPRALVATYGADEMPATLELDLLGQVRRDTTYDDSLLLDGSDFEVYLETYVAANKAKVDAVGDPIIPRPLAEHTIYEVFHCSGNNTLTMPGPMILENVVILTDCKISLSAGVRIYSSMILTSAGDPAYDVPKTPLTQNNDYSGNAVVNGSANVQIGTGTCSNPDGGSVIVAAGDISFPSGMEVNFSQVLTKGDLSIAANGNGTKGTSLWAWGSISMQSNGAFTGCTVFNGRSAGVIPEFFRLVN